MAREPWCFVAALLAVMITSSVGCSEPRTPYSPPDAGPPPVVDLGPWIVDGGAVVYPEPCGFQGVCPEGSQCVSHSVCSTSRTWSCQVQVEGGFPQPSHNGEPCAVTTRPYDGARGGVTLPVELCVALADPSSAESQTYAGVFDEGCEWSDGSAVVGPLLETGCYAVPPVLVPGGWTTGWFFCGGTCGDESCDYLQRTPREGDLLSAISTRPDCVGRSDERAFGVCAVTSDRCGEGDMGDVRACETAFFAGVLGDEAVCACMFTGDPPTGEGGAQGWVVPRTVCTRYREIFPDTVACRDAAFALIP